MQVQLLAPGYSRSYVASGAVATPLQRWQAEAGPKQVVVIPVAHPLPLTAGAELIIAIADARHA